MSRRWVLTHVPKLWSPSLCFGPPPLNWSTSYDKETEDQRWQSSVTRRKKSSAKLRQVEVLVGQGMARIDAIRRISITEQTYYRWRKHYGGMGTDQLKELKRLQKENERLRTAVSDLTLDKLILAEGARGNF